MRILVIDDERDIRDTMKLLLEHYEHEVQTAADGVEALERASQWRPDAVLMDLSMPAMDGFLATRKLRAVRDDRPMLIIACSAHLKDPMTRDLALAAGADECIAKPLDWAQLDARLTQFAATIAEHACSLRAAA